MLEQNPLVFRILQLCKILLTKVGIFWVPPLHLSWITICIYTYMMRRLRDGYMIQSRFDAWIHNWFNSHFRSCGLDGNIDLHVLGIRQIVAMEIVLQEKLKWYFSKEKFFSSTANLLKEDDESGTKTSGAL